MRRIHLSAPLLLFLAAPVLPASAQQPLFSDLSPVEFTLEADFDQLKKDRDQETEERPGRVLWSGPNGEAMELPVKVRTRGIFRLKRSTCPFPPLRLNFPKKEAEGTIFEGQDKLKMVTYCRDRDSYEQNILEEYLTYRIYNLMTDIGFRVRLANVTYVDTSGEDDPVTRMGFFLEDEDAMATRLDGTMLEVAGAPAEHFRQDQAALMYVYQFLIGNTDFSMTRFHNVKVMRIGTDYYPVPYDFDFSGFVDAPYAGVAEQIAHLIRDVKERLYRGICDDRIDYQAAYARFVEAKDAIMETVASEVPQLSERNRRDRAEYVEDFYRVITDERRAKRYIADRCRG